MKNLKFKLGIVCLFLLPSIARPAVEDSTSASVKLSLRYVLATDKTQKTARTIKDGETGNMPVSMNLSINVDPFLWMKSPVKNVFLIFDSRFHQDRTSGEFGVGFRKENIEVYASYGFRAIRVDDDVASSRSLSSNFDTRDTKSVSVCFSFDLAGIGMKINTKASYDGLGEWFYIAQSEIFPFEESNPIHLILFHESYFGSGTYLVFTSRNKATDFFSGYLFPEDRSEQLYRRSEGILFGFTHTWR